MAYDGHVAGAEALAEAGLILLERYVEDPMQGVLDAQWPRMAWAARAASRASEEM